MPASTLTSSAPPPPPEILDLAQALVRALAAFAGGVARTGADPAARPAALGPEDTWLTTSEAMAFLRLSRSALARFRAKHPELRVSTGISPQEPRYQLASLQKFMAAKAVGDSSDVMPIPAADPLPTPRRRGKPPAQITMFPYPPLAEKYPAIR